MATEINHPLKNQLASPGNPPRPSADRLNVAYQHAAGQLASGRNERGHWTGELSASALSTATAISAFSFYLKHGQPTDGESKEIQRQVEQGFAWLVGQQNEDGGFGDTAKNYSNISTTMLVVAAAHAAGRQSEFQTLIVDAQRYIDAQGSIEGLRARYGKDKTFAVPILANCAMAGIVPWSEVSALPFEAACVPQRFYHLMQLPVVSYAIPALVAIGQVKFHSDPPWDPVRKTIRRLAIDRSLNVLEQMQPAGGGYLEAVPLTSFVTMGLVNSGKSNHPVVKRGVGFILDSFRAESNSGGPATGSWPIDTNLATWSTTLTVNALANHDQDFNNNVNDDYETWRNTLDWILSCQNKSKHPFTGSPPGGWGWTDLAGAVPDADDTPGALLAIKNILATGKFENRRTEIVNAAKGGIEWLLKLQNRDNGWPTFCRGWGKLPFDRSGADLTAHVIRGLLAWQDEFSPANGYSVFQQKISAAIERGFQYLSKTQAANGSWNPLWFGNQDQPDEINPFYGTAKVLAAYRDANRFDTQQARFGLNWIAENQNQDGGFGGGPSIVWEDSSLGFSSVEETSLCCEILFDSADPKHVLAAWRGIDWLARACEADCVHQCSPIGFYFAKLWYFEKSYPLIFATAALAKACNTVGPSP